jgi:hypothetical protein
LNVGEDDSPAFYLRVAYIMLQLPDSFGGIQVPKPFLTEVVVKTKIICSTILALGISGTAVGQGIHIAETFESYATTADMLLAWPSSQPDTFLLMEGAGEGAEGSSKWIRQNVPTSAASITRDLTTPVPANSTQQINLSYYIRSDNYSNSRTGISIRDNGLSTALFHVGPYNAATHNTANPGNKWVARITGFPGLSLTQSGYYTLLNGPNRPIKPAEGPAVWTKLEMHATGTAINFEVNDVEDTADALVTTANPTLAMNKIRVGLGNSPNAVIDFDSIYVWTGADTSVGDWDLY